ncbi:sigma-70 family RNA polymerase sigma factor [Fodinicola acaciae]|uniref:sigma-70 family RNA polymerase sigma factor n=1 Tax=Fodinicola acaciae TaxID=2681555 RepID=UPI001FE5EF38|nr:sigma-70 family RNA polymerase sigma factor [Fodinicola acaciae]
MSVTAEIDVRLEEHRAALTGYCYRMLGSGSEAEDAVQEAFVRAWRGIDSFRAGRASFKTWLYAIATNVCFDMLRSGQRRARPMDLSGPAQPGPGLDAPLPETAWIQPVPDSRVLSAADPAELAVERETIRLAFVAALQHLRPRQRAVLILRDVLRWKADEVAGLLDTSVASVNSALQRARTTMQSRDLSGGEPLGDEQRKLLERYIAAFERYDVYALTALLHEDATMSMPPFAWWLRGREHIATALRGSDGSCHGSRFVPTAANGVPAYGQYVPRGDALVPWALVLFDVRDGRIAGMCSYLSASELFPLFGLPLALPLDGARQRSG